MMVHETAAGLVALIVVTVIAAVIRSAKNPDGKIRKALETKAESDSAHQKVNEGFDDVQEMVERTHEQTERIETKVDRVDEAVRTQGELIVVLHEDDEDVHPDRLRDRLAVDDLPNDVLRRDGGEPGPEEERDKSEYHE